MKLVIIDPGSGNLASVLRAFQKVAAEAGVAADISVTRNPADILAADRVVLPGQGAFAACRRGLPVSRCGPLPMNSSTKRALV